MLVTRLQARPGEKMRISKQELRIMRYVYDSWNNRKKRGRHFIGLPKCSAIEITMALFGGCRPNKPGFLFHSKPTKRELKQYKERLKAWSKHYNSINRSIQSLKRKNMVTFERERLYWSYNAKLKLTATGNRIISHRAKRSYISKG